MSCRGPNLEGYVPNPGNGGSVAIVGIGFLQSRYIRSLTKSKVGGINHLITSLSLTVADSFSNIL